MECLSCQSIAGIKSISPGKPIFISDYWIVEHAYPTSLEGWIVIVLKRHCEELHKLSHEEFIDLTEVQEKVIKAIHKYFKSDREYVFCFAEGEGFKHIHFHVVPKHKGFDSKYNGVKVFHYLKTPKNEWIPPERIIEICSELSRLI